MNTKEYKSKLNITLPPVVIRILEELSERGWKGLLVGGIVRDAFLGMESKDIDVEVFGADYGDLNSVLEKHGRTDLVGKSFGVIKLVDGEGNIFDFSLPRRDSKIMDKRSDVRGRGISSEFDPSIAPKEAAARRDFTINAMAFDPLSGEVHDYFGGVNDLKNRILRATSEAFAEDPLRVLRGMQFAARFGMEVEARTAGLAAGLKNEPLVVMRVYEEWMKLFTRGKFPGKGIQYLIDTGWIENYPELKAIVNIQQDPEWHPEGTVDVHTALVMDAAAVLADGNGITGNDRAVLVAGALLHDLGKPETTCLNKKGRVASPGHAAAGVKHAESFLRRIGMGDDLKKRILPLVKHHMVHLDYSPASKKMNIRQIAHMVFPATIRELEFIIMADHMGRATADPAIPDSAKLMFSHARDEGVYRSRPEPLLRGRDLLKISPAIQRGKLLGDAVRFAYAGQLHNSVHTKDEAVKCALDFLKRFMLLINGDDVISAFGGRKGKFIQDVLALAWDAQLRQEFDSREGSLAWLERYAAERKEREPVAARRGAAADEK